MVLQPKPLLRQSPLMRSVQRVPPECEGRGKANPLCFLCPLNPRAPLLAPWALDLQARCLGRESGVLLSADFVSPPFSSAVRAEKSGSGKWYNKKRG